jgi:hypothetical protein
MQGELATLVLPERLQPREVGNLGIVESKLEVVMAAAGLLVEGVSLTMDGRGLVMTVVGESRRKMLLVGPRKWEPSLSTPYYASNSTRRMSRTLRAYVPYPEPSSHDCDT